MWNDTAFIKKAVWERASSPKATQPINVRPRPLLNGLKNSINHVFFCFLFFLLVGIPNLESPALILWSLFIVLVASARHVDFLLLWRPHAPRWSARWPLTHSYLFNYCAPTCWVTLAPWHAGPQGARPGACRSVSQQRSETPPPPHLPASRRTSCRPSGFSET